MAKLMTATALRQAAEHQESIDRIDAILNKLDAVLGPNGGEVVYLGVLDGDGEGSYYGNECVALKARDAHALLRDLKSDLIDKMRKLGVDALAD